MRSSPSRQAEARRPSSRSPFAHRGLHGGGRVENSRAAFEAAIAAGHGIELDVQASADGQAMVFHDYELDRLTEGDGPDLRHGRGRAGADPAARRRTRPFPRLPEILALIDGRAPLLIEVKSPGRDVAALSRSGARRRLQGYKGPVAVMSFNPEVGRWFARHAPEVLRGLVVTEAGKSWRGWLSRRLALWRSQARFSRL